VLNTPGHGRHTEARSKVRSPLAWMGGRWAQFESAGLVRVMHGDAEMILRGSLCFQGEVQSRAVAGLLKKIQHGEHLNTLLQECHGQFCVVYRGRNERWVASDWLGSMPAYVVNLGGELGRVVSDDSEALSRLSGRRLNRLGVAQFLSSVEGVTPSRTLFEGVLPVSRGSVLSLDTGKQDSYLSTASLGLPIPECASDAATALRRNIAAVIRPFAGKGAIRCDLTQGVDTRSLAVVLKDLQVQAEFRSLGAQDSPDVVGAREVAKRMNLPWQSVIVSEDDERDFHLAANVTESTFPALYYGTNGVDIFHLVGMGGSELCDVMFPEWNEIRSTVSLSSLLAAKWPIHPLCVSYVVSSDDYRDALESVVARCVTKAFDVHDLPAGLWLEAFCAELHAGWLGCVSRFCSPIAPFLDRNTALALLSLPRSFKVALGIQRSMFTSALAPQPGWPGRLRARSLFPEVEKPPWLEDLATAGILDGDLLRRTPRVSSHFAIKTRHLHRFLLEGYVLA
jgi:hypothetical protein